MGDEEWRAANVWCRGCDCYRSFLTHRTNAPNQGPLPQGEFYLFFELLWEDTETPNRNATRCEWEGLKVLESHLLAYAVKFTISYLRDVVEFWRLLRPLCVHYYVVPPN